MIPVGSLGGNKGGLTLGVTRQGLPGFQRGGPYDGIGVPTDEQGQLLFRQAAAARAAYDQQLDQQIHGIKTNYGDQLVDQNTQHPLDIGAINNNYGSSGLGFSSGYGNAQQQLAHTYQTNLDRLTSAKADTLNTIRQNRGSYAHYYDLNLEAIRQAAIDRLSASAGTLGLGGNKSPSALLNGN